MKKFLDKIKSIIKNSGFFKSDFHINLLFTKDIINNKMIISFELDLTKNLSEEIPKLHDAIRKELDLNFNDFICQNIISEEKEE